MVGDELGEEVDVRILRSNCEIARQHSKVALRAYQGMSDEGTGRQRTLI